MTPKEKAMYLVEKMYYIGRYDDKEEFNTTMAWERAKQGAMVAVIEMKSEINRFADNKYRLERMFYLDEVITEIIKE